MKRILLPVIATAFITSFGTLFAYNYFGQKTHLFAGEQQTALPVNYVNYSGEKATLNPPPIDFTNAAEGSVKAVVHIKTTINSKTVLARDPFAELFGENHLRPYKTPEQMGSGSGVVISPDGYIVTNNHVVSGADVVTVTFNDRKTAKAKVIGTDPSTDLAVLKIDEENLPYMEFGNSDNVKLGEWVLAVGYPLSLDATVTAGIVSAKARSIGINATKSRTAVESFIQTDAAVNPGNSGGPLVNTSGQLIGINSAIASPTGSYAGYSYSIPANIVKKATADIIKYGAVQRGFLGIEPKDFKTATAGEIEMYRLDERAGVLVANVSRNGGAHTAGIQKGDLITAIDNNPVASIPQLNEQLTRFKPGDHVNVSLLRSGKAMNVSVELKNIHGTTELIKESSSASALLGATLRTLNSNELRQYKASNGVVLDEVGEGVLAEANIRKGFVITGVDGKVVKTSDDVFAAVKGKSYVQLEGFYPGRNGMYYYNIRTGND